MTSHEALLHALTHELTGEKAEAVVWALGEIERLRDTLETAAAWDAEVEDTATKAMDEALRLRDELTKQRAIADDAARQVVELTGALDAMRLERDGLLADVAMLRDELRKALVSVAKKEAGL